MMNNEGKRTDYLTKNSIFAGKNKIYLLYDCCHSCCTNVAKNVVFLIAKNAALLNAVSKKDTQKVFREKLVAYINDKYQFYKVKPNKENFIDKHFKLLNGKVYKPSRFERELILAFEKGSDIDGTISQIEPELEEKLVHILE